MFHRLLRSSVNLAQIYQIHAQITVHGLPIYNDLLAKLVELRCLGYARSVFNQITFPTEFSWNSMFKCYTHSDFPEKSMFLYSEMLRNDAEPTNFTYPFLLKACSVLSGIKEGEQFHAHVVKFGFHLNIFVNNALIDMYCKCSCMSRAHQVLDEMQERDEVSWNSIISGYVNWGEIAKARELFEEMPINRNVVCWTALINGYGKQGDLIEMLSLFLQMLVSADYVEPNSATMVCVLSACSSVSDLKLGRWISVFIVVNRIPSNILLSTSLIDMHSKCGDVEKARRFFDGVHNKNLVCWNAMITGYVQQGLHEEAIQLFRLMQNDFMKPDEITLVNMLSACAGLGAHEFGREVHLYLGRNMLHVNVILATSLIDMYSKCGNIDDACLVFVKTRNKDLALWNVMIQSLAHHSKGRDALSVHSLMESNGANPNDITFIGVLSACNHSGLVEEGWFQFSNMIVKHGLSPKVEHYACMVDLLGRAGHLVEAVELVQNMVVPPDSIIWGSLLNACRIHRNIDLADKIGEAMLSGEDSNLGFFVLLSNIYKSVGRWNDVVRVRRLVKKKGIRKPAGCSWIEVGGIVRRFLVEDKNHLESEQLYDTHHALLNQLKFEGY